MLASPVDLDNNVFLDSLLRSCSILQLACYLRVQRMFVSKIITSIIATTTMYISLNSLRP